MGLKLACKQAGAVFSAYLNTLLNGMHFLESHHSGVMHKLRSQFDAPISVITLDLELFIVFGKGVAKIA